MEKLHNQHNYICTFWDCKAAFSELWRLEAHLCKHMGERPFSCRNCDKRFCTRYQLTSHELSHSLKCLTEGCSEAFVTSNHLAQIHKQQEKRYQCDREGCEKDFNKRYKLKAHKFEHGDPPPFCCTFNGCTKEFPTQGKLKHHERVHEGYPCDFELCPFCAKTWSEYLKHREEHKVFFSAKTGVSSREKKYYLCTRAGCDKKFSRLFRLKDHEVGDHEGQKPFSCACPGCGKSFAVKETLWRHSKEHNPAKKKKHPKKNQTVTQSAAANEEETTNLTVKLQNTTLKEKS